MKKKAAPCCRGTRVGIALLARQIARDLFTNGMGQVAGRLVLTIDGPPKQDLGGWGEHSVADRIELALMRGRYHPAKKGA